MIRVSGRSAWSCDAARAGLVVALLLVAPLPAGCGPGGTQVSSPPTSPDAASPALAAAWGLMAFEDASELEVPLVELASGEFPSEVSFPTAWRVGADLSIEWVSADGSIVQLSPRRLAALHDAVRLFEQRDDLSGAQKRTALLRVAALGGAMADAANRLEPQSAVVRRGLPLAAQVDLGRAAVEASTTGLLLQRIALESLERLPEGAVPRGEIASLRDAMEASRDRASELRRASDALMAPSK